MVVKSIDGGKSFGDPIAAAQLEDGFSDTPYSAVGDQTVYGHQMRWASAGNISVNPRTRSTSRSSGATAGLRIPTRPRGASTTLPAIRRTTTRATQAQART